MTRYVALGDSFTCGTEAERPFRWPDLVARALEVERYENFASVGATSRDVEAHQLGPALALEPDLVSLICGANDVLESVRPDSGAYAARLATMLERIRAAAPRATVLTATYPDLSHFLALRPRTARRVRGGMGGFNDAVRSVARRHGILCLDWSDRPESGEPALRADDDFHPSAEGHERAAREVLLALGESIDVLFRARKEATV